MILLTLVVVAATAAASKCAAAAVRRPSGPPAAFGFFAVGVTLAGSGVRGLPPLDGPTLTAIGCKLVAAPALVLLLHEAFVDVPDVYLVQPAMACALNSLVVANEYGLDRRVCAGAIAWTTVLVLAAGLVVSLV